MAEVSRQDIQSAFVKATELRALHSALVHNNLRFNSSSPRVPQHHHVALSPPHDYPVFTPSYEEEPVPGYQQLQLDSQALSDYWDGYSLVQGTNNIIPDNIKVNTCSKKNYESLTQLINSELHICPAEDQISTTSPCPNNLSVMETSPRSGFCKSRRRNSLGDLRNASSSCNKCKPAIISSDSSNGITRSRHFNMVAPLTDSHSSAQTRLKKGSSFSRFFLRLKKKNKNDKSPDRAESEDFLYKDLGIMSIERLKHELLEANESRDAALMEVSEMKSSLGELKQKLENLETYCEELKNALKKVIDTRNNHFQIPGKRKKSIDGNEENKLPVSNEVMVEGFMQVVSEARLSVKHFCKILVSQIDETDSSLVETLDSLLQPYKLSLNSKFTKAVLFHLEAIVNQTLYQDFENLVFVKNGCPEVLDPHEHRQTKFSQFVSLRNLSWNEVLLRGTKYYSDEFSKFCDQKMRLIISTLNWMRPWPEQLLHSFFVAAKCIWLLHLLAFSFDPALGILRVEDNSLFDGHYMEDLFIDKQRSHSPSRVKIMVMPGFYVQERVLRCMVLCRHKSVA